MRNLLPGILCLLLLAPAYAAPAPVALAHLTILARDGTQHVLPGVARFDFGNVSALQTDPPEHRFTLRNDTSKTLTIQNIQTSCGCTSAVASVAGKTQPPPFSVTPGQQFALDVSVEPTHLAPGASDKLVRVTASGQREPLALLQIAGTLVSPVTFSPATLDFGHIAHGTSHSLVLTLTETLSLMPATPLKWTSSRTDVRVTPRDRPTTPEDSSGLHTTTYTVTVQPNAPLGPLQGQLTFVSGRAMSTDMPEPASFPVPITGEVVGDVSARPAAVTFGSVRAGKAAVQTVTLTAVSRDIFTGLRIRSESPYVSARLQLSRSQTAGTLRIALRPNAPAGVLQTQVILRTGSGQILPIPIFAAVFPASQSARK